MRTWPLSKLSRLRSLEEDNHKLKKVVADLILDKQVLPSALETGVIARVIAQ
jgi:hypothetical protein